MSNGKDKIVARMVKFHSNDVTGIRRHNERELSDESLAKSPSWIRPEDSHLNYDLVDGIKMTSKVVDKRLEALRDSRGGKRKLGKNGVRVCEWLISNNYGYMSSLDEAEQRRYFESNLQFFKDRYGDECIAYAKVHMDESTPHMHLGILPVTEDGRVNANDIFTRATLREIQTELAEHLQNDGFDVSRGEMDSKRKHLSTIEYKAKKVSEGWAEHQQIMAELEADRLGFDEVTSETINILNDQISTSNDIVTNVVSIRKQLNADILAYKQDKAIFDKEKAEFEREKELWESQKRVREKELQALSRQIGRS